MASTVFLLSLPLPALKPDPPQITETSQTHIHPLSHTQAEAHTLSCSHTHIPELVCEILRLIEKEECDLVTPCHGEGCYKCVCVCVCLMLGSKWLYVHFPLACYSQKCPLSFFSPFQFCCNGLNTAACSVDTHLHTCPHTNTHTRAHSLTQMHIYKHTTMS